MPLIMADTAAEALFEALTRRGMGQIEEWLREKRSEDLHLDFKEKTDPTTHRLSDDDRKNFSEALSGFSNSDGGVILWGVKAKRLGPDTPDVAQSPVPLTDAAAFRAELEAKTPELLTPPNSGVRSVVIRADDTSSAGFVATLVVASDRPPHRSNVAKRREYYKRSGSTFYPMEHFDLEDMFGRRMAPRLALRGGIHDAIPRFNPSASSQVCTIRYAIGLENVGRRIAQYPFLTFDFTGNYSRAQLPTLWLPYVPGSDWRHVGGADHVIHPGLKYAVAGFSIRDVRFQNHRVVSEVAGVALHVDFGCDLFPLVHQDIELSGAELVAEIEAFARGDRRWD